VPTNWAADSADGRRRIADAHADVRVDVAHGDGRGADASAHGRGPRDRWHIGAHAGTGGTSGDEKGRCTFFLYLIIVIMSVNNNK